MYNQNHYSNSNKDGRRSVRWSQQNVIDEERSMNTTPSYATDDVRSQVTPMQIVLQNRRDHGSYNDKKVRNHEKTQHSQNWKIANSSGGGFHRPSVQLLPISNNRLEQTQRHENDDDEAQYHDNDDDEHHHCSKEDNTGDYISNGSIYNTIEDDQSAFIGSVAGSSNGDYVDTGSVYNTPNFGDSSVAFSQNWNDNASTYTTATQYMSLRKMEHLYCETSSEMWLPEASGVKFKWGDNKFCRLIHGTSTLGGSMIRVADWETNDILDTFEVDDIIGSKLIASSDLKKDKGRTSSRRGGNSQARSSTRSSDTSGSNGHLYEEFPAEKNTHAGSELHIYSYPRKRKQGVERAARASRLQRLELAVNCHSAKACVRSINALANPRNATSTTCTRFLVILNSYYEKNRAKYIYDKYVQRMMNEADIEHDVFETIYPGHAHDRIREVLGKEQVDVIHYDGVVVIGRDGLMCEVVRGVMERRDRHELLRKTAFGIVPTSCGNGIAESIMFACQEMHGPLEATFLICKGRRSLLDLAAYQLYPTERYKDIIGCSTFSWSVIKTKKEDDQCISVSPLRLTPKTAWKLTTASPRRVRLSLLPSTRVSDLSNSIDIPPVGDPVPNDWDIIESEIFLFIACQLSHVSQKDYLSPQSDLDDCVFQVFLFRKPPSSYNVLRLIKKIQSGDASSDLCEKYCCVAFRFEPHPDDNAKDDFYGELDCTPMPIQCSSIQGQVLPHMIQVFSGEAFHGESV
eukprot:CAMPEP_0196806564 /NCGR_PEP_ID=MMETSP1362-20130617/6454_1 /TAXON_ID=163516 /ORGANISM="Leptocylindrus danicus, Strain CCMP1856" /LENGTH=742 /DNA_ID=CAMNT_0042180085 /DNA_START=297 /DNA_END=2525 /DNA_ORIENTATION=+